MSLVFSSMLLWVRVLAVFSLALVRAQANIQTAKEGRGVSAEVSRPHVSFRQHSRRLKALLERYYALEMEYWKIYKRQPVFN